MLYTGEFYNMNGKLYKCEIVTGGSRTPVTNFKFGGTPFTVSMDSDGKHIYAPIKSTGATITMLTRDYNFDLYSGQAQGNTVKLLSGDNYNTVEWSGYVSPCMFDQGFQELEEIEIEAVDGISVLKSIPYDFVSSDHIATFAEVIFKCLKKSGTFKNFYVSDNVQLSSASSSESVIEKFRINEQNFFEELKDQKQEACDVAWKCYDVLYQIGQYLGYTLYPDKDEVYIIDYDAIIKGNNTYYKYSLTGSKVGTPTKVTVSKTQYIENNHASNAANVELDKVYNKVSVTDEFYTYDTLLPEFGNDKFDVNITAPSDSTLLSWCNNNNGVVPSGNYVHSDVFTHTIDGKSQSYVCMITKSWRNNSYWAMVWKFYHNKSFKTHHYSHQTSARTDVSNDEKWSNNMKFSYLWDAHGCTYAGYFQKEISGNDFNKWRVDYSSNWSSLTEAKKQEFWTKALGGDYKRVTFTKALVCINHDNNHIGPGDSNKTGNWGGGKGTNEDVLSYPALSMKTDKAVIFGGDNAYFIISGKYRCHDEASTPYPLRGDTSKLKHEMDYKYQEECFLWASLNVGNLWFAGDRWTETKSYFKIWWRDENAGKIRCKDYFNAEFDFVNTAAKYVASEKGYYIPAPEGENISGIVDFKLYMPRDMWGDSRRSHWGRKNNWAESGYSRYYTKVGLITAFNIKAKLNNGMLDEDMDSDTVYTNIIENGSLDELKDIKFKVCTFDHKKATWSSVDYLDSSGKSQYVDKIYNKALYSRQVADGSGGHLKSEEHLVYKLVTQYERPRVIFSPDLKLDENNTMMTLYTDKTLSGYNFIAQEISTDYRACTQSVKLIEKF